MLSLYRYIVHILPILSVCASFYRVVRERYVSFLIHKYMPIPDGDKASEHSLLQKMIPTAGIFCLKEGDNYDRRKKEKEYSRTEDYHVP